MSRSTQFDPIPCPYCQSPCEAEWCDVGVGHVQCGPYHCLSCHASQIGPCDEDRPLTPKEIETGWYAPGAEPGSSANVIAGQIVTSNAMKAVYRAKFEGNPEYHVEGAVEKWWEEVRKRMPGEGIPHA